jgi:transcriptional regulator with XRE-family HTH domain
MQDLTVGRVVRAVRRHQRLTQRQVADRAAVSQQTVSVIELGRLDQVDLLTLRRVGAAVGIDLPFAPRWRGPELDRLLDADHARLVEAIVRRVSVGGWQVIVEWSFNHFGERGSADALLWHAGRRALLVVEVKSRVVDLQDLLGTLDRKVRVARTVLPPERGWRPDVVGRVVVLPDSSTARDAVARHRATFDAALPQRTVDVRRWLRDPTGELRAVWFLRVTSRGRGADR